MDIFNDILKSGVIAGNNYKQSVFCVGYSMPSSVSFLGQVYNMSD